jgi:carbon storage regulator
MLVLSRRADETIVIDGRISVRVLEIRGKQVRLGIEAPQEVPIHRKELDRAIRQHRPSTV